MTSMGRILGAIAYLTASAAAFDPKYTSALLPTAEPTGPLDPTQCDLFGLNFTSVFDVPKPTGSLSSAIYSYYSELNEAACTPPRTDLRHTVFCAAPEASAWCGFTTAAPPELLPALTAHASEASAWWVASSSKALSLASRCPYALYNGGYPPFGMVYVNRSAAFVECVLENRTRATVTGNVSPIETTSTASTGDGVKSSPTETGKPSGAVFRARPCWEWLVVISGLVATLLVY